MEGKSPIKKGVSLKDIQEHTPAESDEDKLIMKEAEKVNPTTGSIEPVSSFTLVPKSLEREGESADDTRELKSIEDELYAATVGLNDLHQDDVAQVYTNKEGKEKSQTARFAGSAGQLFKRSMKGRAKVRDENSTRNESLLMEAGEMGKKQAKVARSGILLSMQDFRDFVSPSKNFFYLFIRGVLLFVIVPATGLACFLYYVIPDKDLAAEEASSSWWILFLFVRQPITFGLPKFAQFIVVDYWFMHTELVPRLLGPYITLFVVQSKGWPFHLAAWGIIDLMMLFGSGRFAKHWMFYQDTIEVFSEENPAGEVLEAKVYQSLLIFAIVAGVLVTAKRYYIGLSFGKATYSRYSEKLSSILKDSLLVSSIARFSDKAYETEQFSIEQQVVVNASSYLPKTPTKEGRTDGRTGGLDQDRTILSASEKKRIIDLLEDWEEIDLSDKGVEVPSISSIVQFRASESYLCVDFPFSPAFGFVKTRVQMVDGAQEVYTRLIEKQNDGNVLTFQTIAQTAVTEGKLEEERVKELVRLFRPTRDGLLTLLDFCKSIDALYKDLRLLRVALANEAKMNRTSETIINIFFYFIMGCAFLSIIGIDPVTLFAALAGFIVGFAFMIGGAASKYFEGVLMILIRRPYDIGDRIAIQGAEDAPSSNGAPGWIVKDVTLYHTTVIYGASQEYATYSNGSLASSRIINANRSPRAVLSYKMRFGLSVETETVQRFKKLVEAFVKERPREWLAFSAFRLTAISADLGFVEYITIVQHREGWHQIGALLTSLALVQTYAFDLSQEMGMGYDSPKMPVELHVAGHVLEQSDEQGAGGLQGITSMLLGNP